MKDQYNVLIIGGGTGGIMLASKMVKERPHLKIAIMEPADKHYYQPAYTLVGAGTYDMADTVRNMKDIMPKGVTWIKEYATEINPDQNQVKSSSGTYGYEYLVVAPGLVMAPELIEGLEDALDKGVVCSNYTDPEHTWKVLQNFKGGNALFTQPATPIKCGGAPQKIMYLAADYFRKHGLSNKTNVIFATPGTVIFGVPEVKRTLDNVLRKYGVFFMPYHAPVKIDADNQVATFKVSPNNQNECIINEDPNLGIKASNETMAEIPFDMLHLAPPQKAPDLVAKSPLAADTGWMDVDKHTLQSTKYENVFGLGDIMNTPTAKTGAAIRKQVPVVLKNLYGLMDSGSLSSKQYHGYSSCPLVTGYGKMVLAEFDYDNKFTPDPMLKLMGVFDSSKEHWRLWMLKKYGLPYLYWNKMMKGKDV